MNTESKCVLIRSSSCNFWLCMVVWRSFITDEFEEEVQAEMEKQKKEAKASQRRKRVSSTTDRHASTTECTVSKAMTSSEVTKSTVSTTSNMEKKQKELSDSEDAKRATVSSLAILRNVEFNKFYLGIISLEELVAGCRNSSDVLKVTIKN